MICYLMWMQWSCIILIQVVFGSEQRRENNYVQLVVIPAQGI
jgi:hypothetical protein